MARPAKPPGFGSPRELTQAILAGDAAALQWFQERYLPRMCAQVVQVNSPQQLTQRQVLLLALRSLQQCLEQLARLLAAGSAVLTDFPTLDYYVLTFAIRPASFEASLAEAARRQRPVLPACDGFRVELASIPSPMRLSGDVAAVARDGRRLVLVLADAVHHGFVPAMETSALLQAFRNCSPAGTPQEILRSMHDQVGRFVEDGRCPAAVLAVLDGPARTVSVANAGTPGCGWSSVASQPAQPLALRGHLLGLPVDPPAHEQQEFALRPGDQLVLATDGLACLPATRPDEEGFLGPELPLFITKHRGEDLHTRLRELAEQQRAADLDPDDITFVTVTAT
jgi:serine phosphatase RsbU (regulator of sigma subunit)